MTWCSAYQAIFVCSISSTIWNSATSHQRNYSPRVLVSKDQTFSPSSLAVIDPISYTLLALSLTLKTTFIILLFSFRWTDQDLHTRRLFFMMLQMRHHWQQTILTVFSLQNTEITVLFDITIAACHLTIRLLSTTISAIQMAHARFYWQQKAPQLYAILSLLLSPSEHYVGSRYP